MDADSAYRLCYLVAVRPVEMMDIVKDTFEDITTNDTAEEHLVWLLNIVYLMLNLLAQMANEPWMTEAGKENKEVGTETGKEENKEVVKETGKAHFTKTAFEERLVGFNKWVFGVASRLLCHNYNKENTLSSIGVLCSLFLDCHYMTCTVIGSLDKHRPPDH